MPTPSRKYNRLGGRPLQPWHTVEIEERDGSKWVIFHSTIHKDMPVKLTFCFSTQFTDLQILHDHSVMTKFIQHFGVDALR